MRQTIALGDLCHIALGATPPRGSPRYWDVSRTTENVWLSIADMPSTTNAVVSDSKEYLSDEGAARGKVVKKGTLLVSFKLTLGRLAFAGRDLRTNEAIAALSIKDERKIDRSYLYWFLTYFDWQKAAEGEDKVKGKTLNKEKLKALPVDVPPLEEQRRIVALLDDAFAAIATATVSIEKNLENARSLFKRALAAVFEGSSSCVGDHLVLQRGFDITKSQQRPGRIPVVSSGGVKSFHSEAMATGPGVIIGRKGTLGSAFYIESDYWPHDTTLWVKDFKGNDPRLAFYLFRSLDVKKLDSGSANPSLNRNLVHKMRLNWIALDEQPKLVARLDELSVSVESLEKLLLKKRELLEDLRRSLLHKAFSGGLVANEPKAAVAA